MGSALSPGLRLFLVGSVLLLALPAPLRAQSREWETITPGGQTGCGRGAEFRFQFRPGPASGLVIDFQGGGACWDAATCAVSVLCCLCQPTWTDHLVLLSQLPIWLPTASGPPGASGLASTTNEANPVPEGARLGNAICVAGGFFVSKKKV